MSGNRGIEQKNLMDQGPEDPFQPAAIFGNNYVAIQDPKTQEEHEKNHIEESPATQIDFEDFNLSNQPMYTSQSSPVPNQTSPILTPLDDMGFSTQPSFGTTVPEPSAKHVWNVQYWSFLFDVDTNQVLHRVFRGLVFFPPKFFETIQTNPDLYGPFWIATTLVFMMAATGNIAVYFQHLANGEGEKWQFNIDKLSVAAGTIYGYLILIPLILFAIFRYFKVGLRLMDILCIYGYSFFIYVPISFLSVIPFPVVRWTLLGVAAFFSTGLIVVNFFYALRGHIAKAFVIIIIMAALQLGFALVCELYFFSAS